VLPPRRPAVIAPLAASRYQVQFTATLELHDKLRAAQDLLGHAVPSSDLAQVFERALDALLRDLRRRKFGYTDRPRPRASATWLRRRPRTRAIPAAVRREVAARDGEQCTFVDPASGRRCESRADLQFHHLDPYARGGAHDPARVTIRCRAHNLHAARLDYGADFIARTIAAGT
jgi:5-methylcytosine-specific restriction endonuclease McrA